MRQFSVCRARGRRRRACRVEGGRWKELRWRDWSGADLWAEGGIVGGGVEKLRASMRRVWRDGRVVM